MAGVVRPALPGRRGRPPLTRRPARPRPPLTRPPDTAASRSPPSPRSQRSRFTSGPVMQPPAAGRLRASVVQWTHFAAVGVWLGGLAALLLAVRGAESAAKAAAVGRFSRIAAAGLAVVAVTGLLRALDELNSVASSRPPATAARSSRRPSCCSGSRPSALRNRWRSVPAAAGDLRPAATHRARRARACRVRAVPWRRCSARWRRRRRPGRPGRDRGVRRRRRDDDAGAADDGVGRPGRQPLRRPRHRRRLGRPRRPGSRASACASRRSTTPA